MKTLKSAEAKKTFNPGITPTSSNGGHVRAQVRNALNTSESQPDSGSEKAIENLVDHETTDFERQLQNQTGQPLPAGLKLLYGSRFGNELNDVRIHTDPKADVLNRNVGARAFSYQDSIFFANNEYKPETTAGRRVLAHELGHVLQHHRGNTKWGARPAIRKIPRVPENPPFQAEVIPWSTPLHRRPSRNSDPWVDLPRGHVVTVLGGEAWIRVRAEIGGRTYEGYVSHELLRRLPESQEPEEERESEDVAEDVEQEEEQERTPYSGGFTPLQGRISEASEFWVRATPSSSGQIIGMLALEPMQVTVLEESGTRVDNLWFRVRFSRADYRTVVERYRAQLQANLTEANRSVEHWEEVLPRAGMGTDIAMRELQSAREEVSTTETAITQAQGRDIDREAPEGWIGASAFAQVLMPWSMFLDLVAAFESAHSSDSLRDRITRLRQIGEDAQLQGDDIIGYGEDLPGRITQGSRSVNTSDWQLLLETKAVVMPNGEVIDFHHFLLGLDALPTDRRVEDYSYWHVTMGENYSVVTWSGDVGAAALEYTARLSQSWERENQVSEDERARFYFRTRAPEADLLGDIDAWGAYTQISTSGQQTHSSIVDLLVANYGGHEQSASAYEAQVSNVRAAGIRNFLLHYGFSSARNLNSQTSAVALVNEQTHTFADAWGTFRLPGTLNLSNGVDNDELEAASSTMTEIFLEWMEARAREYNVTLGESD